MTDTIKTSQSPARKWVISALSLGLMASTAIPASGQSIVNEATVNGTFGPSDTPLYPSGSEPTDDATVPLVTAQPFYVVNKAVSDPDAAVAGDTLTYTITVQNTGNVTLTIPTITDPGPSFDGGTTFQPLTTGPTLASGDDGDNLFEVGETWVYQATYQLTQADIDAVAGVTDGVTNTVSLTVQDPGGDPATPDPIIASDPTAEATIDVNANLGFTKVAYDAAYPGGAEITGPVNAGQTIYYRFTVTNSSNVTANDIALNDPGALINGSVTPVAFTTGPTVVSGGADLDGDGDAPDLAPNDVMVFEATYIVTQGDIDGQ